MNTCRIVDLSQILNETSTTQRGSIRSHVLEWGYLFIIGTSSVFPVLDLCSCSRSWIYARGTQCLSEWINRWCLESYHMSLVHSHSLTKIMLVYTVRMKVLYLPAFHSANSALQFIWIRKIKQSNCRGHLCWYGMGLLPSYSFKFFVLIVLTSSVIQVASYCLPNA